MVGRCVMRNLSVLLVEDDPRACSEIVAYIEELEAITLVGTTNNASTAVETIKDCAPDAIILDLELHQGGGNGLLVLQAMEEMPLSVRPYVLITTNNSSSVTHEYARKIGADFILSKHQEGYTGKSAVDFLRMMAPMIQGRVPGDPEHKDAERPAQRSKRMRRRISTELNLVGISPKAVGYQYLIDAIELVIEKPVHGICGVIGTRYGKTEASVERAMQNALNRAWKTEDIDQLLIHYTAKISSAKGVPTVTEFVYYYANLIKQEY